MLLVPALVFLAVSLGVGGLYLLLAPSVTARRVRAIGLPADRRESWIASVVQLVGPFAKLSAPEGDWEKSALRLKFLNAGIRGTSAPAIYFGIKTLLPLLGAALAFLMLRGLTQADGLTFVLFVLLAATVGCYLPNLYLRWRIKKRKREIFENFPDCADLMLVCVEAGLGLDAALTRVADELRTRSGALAGELHLCNLEMRAGVTREQALRNLGMRTGVEEIGSFAVMLTQADKFGTSVGESLRVFSDDLRHKRQTRAEEAAAKIPTKMLIPLVVCIFPAIIMVILGPAAIEIIHMVGPMLEGSG